MPEQEFKDAVVVVTGGAQGIGKNIARSFASAGAQVVIDDIDIASSMATVDEFRKAGYAITHLDIDLRDSGAGKKMIDAVVGSLGRIDVLVNNARSKLRTNLQTETEETWHEAMTVNLGVPFFAAQAALAVMAKQESGVIINIGSPAGDQVCHESPAYHVSKAGLQQMTRYLAAQAGSGIRVNCVVPGLVVKDEHRDRYGGVDNAKFRQTVEFAHPMGRPGSADDVARAVHWLCTSAADFMTGQSLAVDGGLGMQEPYDLLANFEQMINNEEDDRD